MFGADVLTFREFMMGEPLPLATLHNAVLEFLQGRDDVVLFGAQAVNAYVQEPRMTQDLDLLSTHAEGCRPGLVRPLPAAVPHCGAHPTRQRRARVAGLSGAERGQPAPGGPATRRDLTGSRAHRRCAGDGARRMNR
jgi:hypothetical protein